MKTTSRQFCYFAHGNFIFDVVDKISILQKNKIVARPMNKSFMVCPILLFMPALLTDSQRPDCKGGIFPHAWRPKSTSLFWPHPLWYNTNFIASQEPTFQTVGLCTQPVAHLYELGIDRLATNEVVFDRCIWNQQYTFWTVNRAVLLHEWRSWNARRSNTLNEVGYSCWLPNNNRLIKSSPTRTRVVAAIIVISNVTLLLRKTHKYAMWFSQGLLNSLKLMKYNKNCVPITMYKRRSETYTWTKPCSRQPKSMRAYKKSFLVLCRHCTLLWIEASTFACTYRQRLESANPTMCISRWNVILTHIFKVVQNYKHRGLLLECCLMTVSAKN